MSARHVGVGLQYLMHPRVCARPGHWPLRLVATPTSHICTRTYSTFCLGPMNSCSVCVCVFALRVSSRHLGLRPHIRLISVDASVVVVAVLSKHASYCCILFSSLFTHIVSLMARVPELPRSHGSTAGLTPYRSAHCMTFPCSYPLSPCVPMSHAAVSVRSSPFALHKYTQG